MALVISPASLLPAPAHTNYQGISIEAGTESAGAGIGAGIGAGAQRMSIGEAVRTDISSFAATVVSYVRSGLQRVKTWLDIAAQRFRSGIAGLLAIAKDLLGLAPLADTSPQLIGVLQEDGLPAQLDDLTGSLLDTATQPVGALLINLNQLSSSLLGGLSDTAGGVVTITDHSVGAVLTTVQDSTHSLLERTNTLVNGTTALLDSTTGGLTSGLTAPIDALTTGVTSATADLVDSTVPKVAATTSGVLQSVNAGLTQVTNGINAISPSIVSQIDADMIAAPDLPNLLDVGDFGGLHSLPMNVGTTVNRLTDGLGGGDHGLLAADRGPILQGLNGAGDLRQSDAGPLCISGCAGSAGPLVSGLGDSVDSLGTGRLLGGPGAGSTDSGGIASAGGPLAGPAGGAGEPAGGGGGLVSSTVKSTGSIVGGVTKSLRRR
jgi:hypothetical protein